MSKNTVRVLPSPTWNWLRVNDIEVADIDTIGTLSSVCFAENENKTMKIPYTYEESLRNCINVVAEKGSKGTLIVDHASVGKGVAAGLTLNLDLKVDSEVTLVEIVNLKNNDFCISGIVGTGAAGSKLKLIQVFLGGKEIYSNVIFDLEGEGAQFELKSAYSLKAEQNLDVNYVINHIAPKTECALDTKGVLYKGAKKTYRGTIDFKKGCKGAVGNEIEDVLLMDDDVVNKTVPVILCAEEDVEGNHGATIGRLSEDLMFYMESRGIPEEEIYSVMASGRLAACIDEIPDDATKDYLHRITGTD